jgi:hypothetical protein
MLCYTSLVANKLRRYYGAGYISASSPRAEDLEDRVKRPARQPLSPMCRREALKMRQTPDLPQALKRVQLLTT